VTLTNGSASFITSSLAAGLHPITAQYSGDGDFSPSTGTLAQEVNNTHTWTGLGSDSNWSDAANWNGAAPLVGSDLAFPSGAPQPVNTSNFAAGTTFNSMAILGGSYTINGNALAPKARQAQVSVGTANWIGNYRQRTNRHVHPTQTHRSYTNGRHWNATCHPVHKQWRCIVQRETQSCRNRTSDGGSTGTGVDDELKRTASVYFYGCQKPSIGISACGNHRPSPVMGGCVLGVFSAHAQAP